MTTSMELIQGEAISHLYKGLYDQYIKLESHKDPYLLTVRMTGTTGGTSAAEIDAPNNVFDGSTTPAKLWVLSSSTDDTDTAVGHCRTVRIFGISYAEKTSPYDKSLGNKAQIQYEDIALSGTVAVETETTWVRVFHMKGLTFGSGGDDAAGTITLSDDASKTTIFHTIAATSVESNGAAIWIPSDQQAVTLKDVAHLTTSTSIDVNSVFLRKNYIYGTRTDEDLSYDEVGLIGYSYPNTNETYLESGNKVLFTQHHVGAANSWFWKATFIVWMTDSVH